MSDIRVYESPTVIGQAAPAAPTDEALGKETFLKLLTTQMQNQDPTSPMKNEEFVAQLAQFSSLEQLMGLQGTMEGVYLGIMSMNNASMASLVGTEVVAAGDQVKVTDGEPATLHFNAASAIDGGTVTIKDESGQVVRTLEVGPQEDGDFEVVWDGKDDDGQPVDDGQYTFSIAGDDGEALDVETLVVGTVTEMDYTTGTPQPSIEGVVVGIDAIRKLTADGG